MYRVQLVILVVFVLGVISTAWPVLPPGSPARLKAEAQEVLQVVVRDVQLVGSAQGRTKVFFRAQVLEVKRSQRGLSPGDMIRIESYHWTSRYVGPKNPPLLAVGWQGLAYLNRAGQGQVYTPAAYGHSFAGSKSGSARLKGDSVDALSGANATWDLGPKE